jgi:hypothetical protein
MKKFLKYSLLKKYILFLLIFIILFIFSGCFATSFVHNARIRESQQFFLYAYNNKQINISGKYEDSGVFSGGGAISFKIDEFWQYSFQMTPFELGFGFNIKRLFVNFDFLFFSMNYFISIYPINLTNEINSILTFNILNHDISFSCGIGNSMGYLDWINFGKYSSLFDFSHSIKYNYLLISISLDYLVFEKEKLPWNENKEFFSSYYINFTYRWFLEDLDFIENDKIGMLLFGYYFY